MPWTLWTLSFFLTFHLFGWCLVEVVAKNIPMVFHWSTFQLCALCQGVSSDCFDSNCEIDPAVVLTRCAANDGQEGHLRASKGTRMRTEMETDGKRETGKLLAVSLV